MPIRGPSSSSLFVSTRAALASDAGPSVPIDGIVCCIFCFHPSAEPEARDLGERLKTRGIATRVVFGATEPLGELKRRCAQRGVRFVLALGERDVRQGTASTSSLFPISSGRIIEDAQVSLAVAVDTVHAEEYLLCRSRPDLVARAPSSQPPTYGAGNGGARHPREAAAASGWGGAY